MTLKISINKEGFEALDESLKGLYIEGDDGSYRLDCDGESTKEIQSLKSALNKERIGRRDAEATAKKSAATIDELNAEIKGLQESSGDDKELKERALLTTSLERKNKELAEKVAEQEATIKQNLVSSREAALREQLRESLPETCHPSVVNDAFLHAKNSLTYSEHADNGKGGYIEEATGCDVESWLQTKVKENPHWTMNSKSGGASGGSTPKPTSKKQTYTEAKKSGDVVTMLQNTPIEQED